jgi:hypothetical protein
MGNLYTHVCVLSYLKHSLLSLTQVQVNEAVEFSIKAVETAVAPLEEVAAQEVARLEVSTV